MNRKILKIILFITFFIGIIILLYPFVSQYYNSKVGSRVVEDYKNNLENIEQEDYTHIFKEAENYNNKLLKLNYPFIEYKKLSNYNNIININNNGMIGYIKIDKLKLELPIYHGTSISVLNVAVGHLEGSSLPIGGESTHSVLAAHRGLPSRELFTNITKLELGDTFTITVLDRTLTYQVDNITVVHPTDTTHLQIEENKDYVTLLTCTPYGLNFHRLLVRGTRIDNIEEKNIIITNEAHQIDKEIVTLIMTIPVIIILIIYIILKPIKKEINYTNYINI